MDYANISDKALSPNEQKTSSKSDFAKSLEKLTEGVKAVEVSSSKPIGKYNYQACFKNSIVTESSDQQPSKVSYSNYAADRGVKPKVGSM